MIHPFTAAELQVALASATPPLVFDVRRAPVFQQAGRLISGAVWRDPERVDEWAGGLDRARRVVVYCVHGHQVSQGCAQKLREFGLKASFLEGGIESWIAAGGQTTANTGAST